MKKRLLSALLALCMVLTLLQMTAWAAEPSGKCGKDVTWSLSNGTLTIQGTGPMYNYLFDDSPWADSRNKIHTVIVQDGVTSIGNDTFWNHDNLISVTLPNSVTSIGYGGFRGCDKLSNINIPNSVTYIDENAFSSCASLKRVTIPNGVAMIRNGTFNYCTSLESITIPISVTNIDRSFKDCNNLTDVYYAGSQSEWDLITMSDVTKNDLRSATIHFNSTSSEETTQIKSPVISLSSVTAAGQTATTVEWSPVTNAAYYSITVYDVTKGSYIYEDQIMDSSVTTFLLNHYSIVEGNTYEICLKAIDANGNESEKSNVLTWTATASNTEDSIGTTLTNIQDTSKNYIAYTRSFGQVYELANGFITGSTGPQTFSYTVPENGVTVLVFFGATGCTRSPVVLREIANSSWANDAKVNLIAIESTGADSDTTNDALMYANAKDAFEKIYYNPNSNALAFWYAKLIANQGNMDGVNSVAGVSLSTAFVLFITNNGGVPCIRGSVNGAGSAQIITNYLSELMVIDEEISTTVPITVPGDQRYDLVNAVYESINKNRAENAVSGLTLSPKLTELAMQRAAECALHYSHTRPNGLTASSVDETNIYSGSIAAENIAAGQTTVEAVMTSWMNSELHRSNILNSSHTEVGVGCFQNNGVLYWVQLFGTGNDTSKLSKTTSSPADVTVYAFESWINPYLSSSSGLSIEVGKKTNAPMLYNTNTGESINTRTILLPVVSDVKSGNKTIATATSSVGTGIITLTGVSSGTGNVFLKAYEAEKNPASVSLSITESIPDPPVISLSSVTAAGQTATTVEWSPVANAAYYSITVYDVTRGSYVFRDQILDSSVTTFLLDNVNIIDGNAYEIYVKAIDVNGNESEKSNVITWKAESNNLANQQINQANIFQTQERSDSCTYAAATSMLRRRAILEGTNDWSSITEASVRNTARASGGGMLWSFTYKGMHVLCPGNLTDNGYRTTAQKKAYFIELLKAHPEGIIIYSRDKSALSNGDRIAQHAILLTDYDASTDTFYCADSASIYTGVGRMKLTESSIFRNSKNEPAKTYSHNDIIEAMDTVWYIDKSTAQKTLVSSAVKSHCPVEMIITINGETLDSHGVNGTVSTQYANMTASGSGTNRNVEVTIYTVTEDMAVELFGTDSGYMTFIVEHQFSDGTTETHTLQNISVNATTIGFAEGVIPQSTVTLSLEDSDNSNCYETWTADPDETATKPSEDFEATPVIESEPVNPIHFSDVFEGDWFYNGVAYAAQNGLMQGVGGGKFNPSGTTTRSMIVTILYRLEGEPAVSQSAFTDVATGQWYTDAVAWAAANKIVEGYGNHTFGPNDDITREQMATILYRYAVYKGYDVSGLADLSSYTDAGSINSWALTAIRWANSEGLITGRTRTNLVPRGTASRAEAATILMRFCQNVAGLE